MLGLVLLVVDLISYPDLPQSHFDIPELTEIWVRDYSRLSPFKSSSHWTLVTCRCIVFFWTGNILLFIFCPLDQPYVRCCKLWRLPPYFPLERNPGSRGFLSSFFSNSIELQRGNNRSRKNTSRTSLRRGKAY